MATQAPRGSRDENRPPGPPSVPTRHLWGVGGAGPGAVPGACLICGHNAHLHRAIALVAGGGAACAECPDGICKERTAMTPLSGRSANGIVA